MENLTFDLSRQSVRELNQHLHGTPESLAARATIVRFGLMLLADVAIISAVTSSRQPRKRTRASSPSVRQRAFSAASSGPLPASQSDGLRRYPDQPLLNNESGERGMIGSREEREALVPNRSGPLELAAVEVPWWNTEEDRLEIARLPALTLQVASNPSLEAQDSPLQPAPATLQPGPPLWPWQLSSALLSLTTLLGFALWWRARRQPAVMPNQQAGPSPRNLLDDLKRSCLANDSQATRHALDAWARQQPETLADMAARFTPLSDALDGLNGALYSESGQHWQGRNLWLAIRSLPAVEDLETSANQEASALPPLYPR